MQTKLPRSFDEGLIYRLQKENQEMLPYYNESDAAESQYNLQIPLENFALNLSQSTPNIKQHKKSANSLEEVDILRSQVECLENAFQSLYHKGASTVA